MIAAPMHPPTCAAFRLVDHATRMCRYAARQCIPGRNRNGRGDCQAGWPPARGEPEEFQSGGAIMSKLSWNMPSYGRDERTCELSGLKATPRDDSMPILVSTADRGSTLRSFSRLSSFLPLQIVRSGLQVGNSS